MFGGNCGELERARERERGSGEMSIYGTDFSERFRMTLVPVKTAKTRFSGPVLDGKT